MKNTVRILLLFSMTPTAIAQNGPPVQRVTVLKTGRLADVNSGKYLEHYGVLIQGERMKELKPSTKSWHMRRRTLVIDLEGATVLPGLIESHQHLLEGLDRKLPEADNMILTVSQMDTAKRALLGAANARAMLDAGFTTVREI